MSLLRTRPMHLLGLAGLCQCANAFKFRTKMQAPIKMKLVQKNQSSPCYPVPIDHVRRWKDLFAHTTPGETSVFHSDVYKRAWDQAVQDWDQAQKRSQAQKTVSFIPDKTDQAVLDWDQAQKTVSFIPDNTDDGQQFKEGEGVIVSVGHWASYEAEYEGEGAFRMGWVNEKAQKRRIDYFEETGNIKFKDNHLSSVQRKHGILASYGPSAFSKYKGAGTTNGTTNVAESHAFNSDDGNLYVIDHDDDYIDRFIIGNIDSAARKEAKAGIEKIAQQNTQRGYLQGEGTKVVGVSKGKIKNYWGSFAWDELFQTLELIGNNGDCATKGKARFAVVARYVFYSAAQNADSGFSRHPVFRDLVLEVCAVPADSFVRGSEKGKVVLPPDTREYKRIDTCMQVVAINYVSSFSSTDDRPCICYHYDRTHGPFETNVTWGIGNDMATAVIGKPGGIGNVVRYPENTKIAMNDIDNWDTVIRDGGYDQGVTIGWLNNWVVAFVAQIPAGQRSTMLSFLNPIKYFRALFLSSGMFLKRVPIPALRLMLGHFEYFSIETGRTYDQFIKNIDGFFKGAHDEIYGDDGQPKYNGKLPLGGPNMLKEVMTGLDECFSKPRVDMRSIGDRGSEIINKVQDRLGRGRAIELIKDLGKRHYTYIELRRSVEGFVASLALKGHKDIGEELGYTHVRNGIASDIWEKAVVMAFGEVFQSKVEDICMKHGVEVTSAVAKGVEVTSAVAKPYASALLNKLNDEDGQLIAALDKPANWVAMQGGSFFSEYGFGTTADDIKTGVLAQAEINMQGLVDGLKDSTSYFPDLDFNYDMHRNVCKKGPEFVKEFDIECSKVGEKTRSYILSKNLSNNPERTD